MVNSKSVIIIIETDRHRFGRELCTIFFAETEILHDVQIYHCKFELPTARLPISSTGLREPF